MSIETAKAGGEGWFVKTCRSCGAEIIWTVTRKGKKMPVDAETTQHGKFLLQPSDVKNTPLAVFVSEQEQYTGPRYTSHFTDRKSVV